MLYYIHLTLRADSTERPLSAVTFSKLMPCSQKVPHAAGESQRSSDSEPITLLLFNDLKL